MYMSGSVAESLGKFAEFVERVDCFVQSFERSRTLEEWRSGLAHFSSEKWLKMRRTPGIEDID